MKIILTPQESEKFFFDALCNGLGYISGYDLTLDYSATDYKKAKEKLTNKNFDATICFEDVLMQILRDGNELTLIDECDEVRHEITMVEVHERVQNTPVRNLLAIIEENDDACDADCVLQTVFLNEIIFG
jgi:hypothetical protein